MSCYDPMCGQGCIDSETGQLVYKIIGKYNPKQKEGSVLPVIPIPCGKCLGCRLDYARRWADRLILELDHTGKGIFLTLTYNDEHVPRVYVREEEIDIMCGQTLDVRDVQLFMKRLRKKFSDREIRFYLVGEYGSTTDRPHYHAIIFGLCLEDFFDCIKIGQNELGQDYFTSGLMSSIWSDNENKPMGYTLMSEVSYKTCAYVARYCMKKAFNLPYGYFTLPEFMRNGFKAEFTLMSRRPGIAGYWYEDHPDCKDLSKFFVSDQNGSVEVNLPSYVLEHLRDIDLNLYYKLVDERKEMAEDTEFMKTYGTELSWLEYKEMEYNDLIERTKVLTDTRKSV